MDIQEILNKIRDLRSEYKSIQNLMVETPENAHRLMDQLNEIDNEIIQLMDEFIGNATNGDTSTK
jgi:uncharacterized coiled-coil DUF342 family protein